MQTLLSWRDRTRAWAGVTAGAAALMVLTASASAAVKVRVYPLGESDPGATVGQFALETFDTQDALITDTTGAEVQDGPGAIINLTAEDNTTAPKYVAGRTGGLALQFDGVNDFMSASPFDPRDMAANRQQYNALSQAWVKPSLAGKGKQQVVWQLGSDNGSVGITAAGFWQVIPGGSAETKTTKIPVAFDEWTHIAILRTGNDGRIYIGGGLSEVSAGFWNGPGTQTLGGNLTGAQNFQGIIDDFNIAGFPDAKFDPATDLDIFKGLLTGVNGDIVQDGVLDVKDYQEWSKNAGYDNKLGAGDPFTLLKGDIDRNGRVNYFDLDLLIQYAQAAGTPLPELLPEPAGAAGLLIGLLAVCHRRRRS
ncbi:MAG: LamG-like jellyroll fold domain-containing protein [Pirellulales bacterium]